MKSIQAIFLLAFECIAFGAHFHLCEEKRENPVLYFTWYHFFLPKKARQEIDYTPICLESFFRNLFEGGSQ